MVYKIDPYTKMERIFEEWKPLIFEDIKPGCYLISSLGRIYSLITNRELSYIKSNGYITIMLQNINNKRKSYYIHRLVAFTFLNILEGSEVINHKNTFRDDNAKYNLEFSTFEDNTLHAIDFYKNNPNINPPINIPGDNNWGDGYITYGENNGMAIWTEDIVHIICKAVEEGKSYSEALIIAGLEDTDNNRYNVSHIVQGKRWKHISKLYNLNPRTQVNFKPYVVPVCELLQEQKYTDKQIAEILQLPGTYSQQRSFIGGIRRRENYTNISCNYNW